MRRYNISVLRSIVISLVVIGHAACSFAGYWGIPIASTSTFFNYMSIYLMEFLMPVFISISGFLFYLSVSKNGFRYAAFIKNKIKRLMVPFVVFWFLWLMPLRSISHSGRGYWSTLKQFIALPAFGPYWFLLVLFGYFLILGFFRKFIEKHRIITFLVCTFICILNPYVGSRLNNNIHNFNLLAVFFYIGYIICRNEKKFAEFTCKWGILILALFAQVTLIAVKNNISLPLLVTGVLEYLIGVFSILLFWGISYRFISLSGTKTVKFIDKNCMALYLFHEPIMQVMVKKFGNLIKSANLLFLVTLIAGISTALIMTFLLRKFNLQWVIGEKITKRGQKDELLYRQA